MAVDGLNTRGAYRVYDTSGSTNYYLKNVQKQADKRAAEQKVLYDDLSKPKMDGIREFDRPEYMREYAKMSDLYSQIEAERDPNKTAQLTLDFKKQGLFMNELIVDSKTKDKEDFVTKSNLLDPVKRGMYTDDAVDRVQKTFKLSRNDPAYQRDRNTLELRLDTNKAIDTFRKSDTYLKSNGDWQDPVSIAGRQNNVNGVYTSQTKTVNPAAQVQEYLTLARNDRNTQLFFQSQYPNLPIEQAVVEFAKGRDLSEKGKSTFDPVDDRRAMAIFNSNLIEGRQNRSNKQTASQLAGLDREQLMTDMLAGSNNARAKVSAIIAGQAGYGQKGLTISVAGSKITFAVPSKTIEIEDEYGAVVSTKTIPSYPITIDKNNPQDRIKLSRMLDDVTGVKVTGKSERLYDQNVSRTPPPQQSLLDRKLSAKQEADVKTVMKKFGVTRADALQAIQDNKNK